MAVRNGNAYVEDISYSLSHGGTPSTCQLSFSTRANVVTDVPFIAFIGGSQWQGYVVDVRDVTTEGKGIITQVRGADFRDLLAAQVMYGQFNMVDKDDGVVYQINDLASGPGSWQSQTLVEGHITPRDLIILMLGNAGFGYEFSSQTEAILYAAGEPWTQTIYNVFNLDWNTGIKVHAALQELAQRLGLQFTIRMDVSSLVIRFTVIGEQDYPQIIWQANFGIEHEIGVGVNLDVDTGVVIVGDRQLDEQDSTVSAAWNSAWNEMFWDRVLLAHNLDLYGLDPLVNTVMDYANAAGAGFQDAGFVEPRKFFNDFTIKDYLNTVPFRVYRIDGMDQVLTADEFAGRKHVRLNHIVTPLVSDPGVQYLVSAAGVHRKTKQVKNPLKVSSTKTVQQSGVRLLESSGHIIFAQPRFQYSNAYKQKLAANAAATSGAPPYPDVAAGHLTPADIVADDPTITCVFLGDVFAEFFGYNLRVGTKHVPHLRVATVNGVEFISGDEKSAHDTATDVATAYLRRPRVVTSGKATFRAFAGHVPSGEISRVTVSMNNQSGITEQVDYSNDEPSLDYDPQIEQRRRIAQEILKVSENKLRTSEQRSALQEQRKEAAGKPRQSGNDFDETHLHEVIDSNKHWSMVQNPDNTPLAFGQPVLGAPDQTSRQLTATAQASLKDGDVNIMGVCFRSTTAPSKIPMQNTGIATALVTGPVKKGDALGYDLMNKALKKVDGGNVKAYEDQSSTTPTLAQVFLGGGGGSTPTVFAVAASTDQHSTSNLSPATLDGVTINDGDTILLKDQLVASENGTYKYTASGSTLTKIGTPSLVIVTAGTFSAVNTDGFRTAKRTFYLASVTGNIYLPMDEFNGIADVVAVAGSVITQSGNPLGGNGSIGVSISGTGFVIDGVVINTPGQTVLLTVQGSPFGTANQNGLWLVQQGFWVFLGQPKTVAVRGGSTGTAKTNFILTAANVYAQMAAGSASLVVARISPDGTSFGGAGISNPPSGNLAIDATVATDYCVNLSLVAIATGAAAGVWKVNTGGAWTKNSPFQPALISVKGGSPQSYYDTMWFLDGGAYIPVVGVWG